MNAGEKQVALVTGSTRGIGRAIARQLSDDGFAVVVLGTRNRETYGDSVAWLTEPQRDTLYVKADVSHQQDREQLVATTVARYGRLDVLVNNAGVAPTLRADILDMTEQSWDRVLDTNCKGNVYDAGGCSRDDPREKSRHN